MINLERLKSAYEAYSTLESSAFQFNDWIAKFDYVNKCGTVCCLLGWSPKLIPEMGFTWCEDGQLEGQEYPHKVGIFRYFEAVTFDEQMIMLYLYGINFDNLEVLVAANKIELPLIHSHSSLREVLNCWEKLIAHYEKQEKNAKSEPSEKIR